jgi:lysophospholipase L1-like esterase
MYGDEAGGIPDSYLTLFSAWLNDNYGPVTVYNKGRMALTTFKLYSEVLPQIIHPDTKINICVLEVGESDFLDDGVPGSSNCGGMPLTVGLSNALVYGTQMQDIISEIKKHMPPDGKLLIVNFYSLDDVIDIPHPNWKLRDYRAILKAYNDMTAILAKANGAKLIDIYSLFEANPSFKKSRNWHPTLAGHVAIAEQLKKAIESGSSP